MTNQHSCKRFHPNLFSIQNPVRRLNRKKTRYHCPVKQLVFPIFHRTVISPNMKSDAYYISKIDYKDLNYIQIYHNAAAFSTSANYDLSIQIVLPKQRTDCVFSYVAWTTATRIKVLTTLKVELFMSGDRNKRGFPAVCVVFIHTWISREQCTAMELILLCAELLF